MSRYCGTNDLINYMFGTSNGTITPAGGTITPSEMLLLQDCLNRSESVVDDYTRRNFLGTTGTVHYNRFKQGQVAYQAFYLNQDLHTLTYLRNGDGQEIPLGSTWYEPQDMGPPYRCIRLRSSYVWVWNTDESVIFAGTWGYGTIVPEDIKAAVIEYAAYLYRLKDTGPGDVAGNPDVGEVVFPKGMPETVKWKLSPYRSRSGGVV